jgi:hypothetical protein
MIENDRNEIELFQTEIETEIETEKLLEVKLSDP